MCDERRSIIMEGREKIRDTEDFDLSSVHPGELSQSSEIISLPSGYRLADLSLASDLTDSEAENEETVLTSRAHADDQNASDDIQHEKSVVKIPNNPFVKSGSILPYFQRSVDSMKKDADTPDRQNEIPLGITEEGAVREGNLSSRKSLKDFCSDVTVVTEGDNVTDMPTDSLDDVRAALQQHCNLLSDRHLLKDLLKSLDDKIEHEPVAGVSGSPQCRGQKQNIPDWKDYLHNSFQDENYKQLVFSPSVTTSFKSLSNDCMSNADFNQGSHVVGGTESFMNQQADSLNGSRACKPLHNAMLDSSPLEQEELQKCPSKLAPHPSLGRHVKFQSAKTSMQDPLVEIDSKECGDNQNHQHCDQQSLEVLKKLAGLRWSLMGWEDVSSSPPTDTSSSLTFLHHLLTSLQTLHWEKKHLKEELTTTLKKLKDLSEDSNTKQHMYEKRETRLVEADRQLGELQQSWASAQEAGQQKVAKFRDRCNVLKQENACLRKESQCLRSEVVELTARTQEHNLIKAQMLETEELLAASKKSTAEVLEENNRVNLCLEENMKHLQELEQVRVPRLVGEVEEWKTRCGGLQAANTQLCGAKVIQGEDFHMLQEQHKILLKKIVEEQEQNAEAEQRKTLLEDEVKGWSGKVAAMKTQLHLHYQAQVEELVVRKSTALQDQLKSLESNLQKTFEERLSAQARSHHATCERLQKRFEEKIKSISASYERQQEAVHSEMKALEDENQRLQQQKQGVITAVSSILGLDHRTGVDPSACVSVAGRGSSRQAGAPSLSVGAVKDATANTAHTPTWDKNVGNLPHLSVHSSSSSDTDESTLFHEGSQTVRHLGEHSHGTLQRDMSLNGYQNGQKKDFVVSTDNDKHPKVGAYGECQSLYGKDNSQTQAASCYLHSGTENCSGSEDGCPNRFHSCKNQKRFDHKESLYPSFTTKIRRASEILQASDLTDEDACYQDGDDVTFTPREDDEIARILNELKMQVSQSTQGAPSEAPTHDTSLDRDPASLTLHRLSQVSSVLSQYVAHS